MRRLMLFWPLFFAFVLVGCEEGEFVPPPSTGGTLEVFLEIKSPEPLIAGDPFLVKATVTRDGSPVGDISVGFTAVNASSESRFVTPNPVKTALLAGTAETTINTAATDRSITVTATAETASASKTFTLVAR